MVFKSEHLKEEFFKCHPMVRLLATHFESLCLEYFSLDPVVTRIFEEIKGSSGIHEVGRAIDFRNEHGGKFMFNKDQVKFLVSEMNRKFPGEDNKKTCIHHSFGGGPYHFHIQFSSGDKDISGNGCAVVL